MCQCFQVSEKKQHFSLKTDGGGGRGETRQFTSHLIDYLEIKKSPFRDIYRAPLIGVQWERVSFQFIASY